MLKKTLAIVLLLILAEASDVLADNRFSVRVFFMGKRYGSDEGFVTSYYAAEGDDPSLYDTRCQMKYHFDSKLGAAMNVAFCYAINETFELECGLGYTSIMMDITQRFNYFRNAYIGGSSYYSSTDYEDVSDYDYDVFNIRPGVNLYLTSGARFMPYIGARLDVKIIRADANLLFAKPYVIEEGGQYHLFIGDEADVEKIHIEGSQALFGAGFESGIEFKTNEGVSISFGLFYDIHIRKAFDDFGDLIEDSEQRSEIKNIGYTYDGMEFTTIGVLLAMKYYF